MKYEILEVKHLYNIKIPVSKNKAKKILDSHNLELDIENKILELFKDDKLELIYGTMGVGILSWDTNGITKESNFYIEIRTLDKSISTNIINFLKEV